MCSIPYYHRVSGENALKGHGGSPHPLRGREGCEISMNTVRVNGTQLAGAGLGLLVVVAGIIVNMKKFGSDLPATNLAMYAGLGILVMLGMFILSRD